jgi:alpha-galactosidase
MTAPVIALVAAVLLVPNSLAAQPPASVHRVAALDVSIVGDLQGFALQSNVAHLADGLEVLELSLTSPQPRVPPRFSLRFAVPSHDVAGQWMTGRFLNKTIRPDWSGGRLQASMFAREAPVSSLFSSDNRNILTFAVSDALNTVSSGSGVREEDGFIYNEVIFFAERHQTLARYDVSLRVDRRPIRYEAALQGIGEWWAQQAGYEPASVPPPARLPVYSTWYNYHQSIDAGVLLKEVSIAKQLGFESIIVDDGWQTMDAGRGYAFTGDWQPERIPDMKGFVDGCHKAGVKVVLWYSVPFVGKNAKAAARFKEKSLQFDERLGAYVIDPRYPDVRQYLVDTYVNAIRAWGIDGLKLDFIDRFVANEQTVFEATNGRDFSSVNEAADRLLTDIMAALKRVKPDVMVEFRQPYIGPLMRKYGNMLRASDSPNAYLANRVKTIDLRLLSGTSAVHADMIMWHAGEPVEIAALQFLNILFSVPQVSVRLQEIPRDQFEMIRFYTGYWNANRSVLLDGALEAPFPLANYPWVRARAGGKQIVALYNDAIVPVDTAEGTTAIDVVNAKHSAAVVLSLQRDLGEYRYEVKDCQGHVVKSGQATLTKGLSNFDVPVSGLVALTRIP